MKKRWNKGFTWLFVLIALSITVFAAWIPQWFMEAQIRSSLNENGMLDISFDDYRFSAAKEEPLEWTKINREADGFVKDAQFATNILDDLTEKGVLPSLSGDEFFCLAVYEDSSELSTLKRASLYVPGTQCLIDFRWDHAGVEQISVRCGRLQDVVYLPAPVQAVSALRRAGGAFSLSSDTAFLLDQESQQVFCVRSRLTQDVLSFSLIRVHP